MSTRAVIVALLFALTLFVVLIVSLNEDGPGEFIHTQATLSQLRQSAGLFIAAVAGLFLLLRALAGEGPWRLVSLVLPLLGGILLVEPDWGVGLALGVTAVAALARPWLAGPTRRLSGGAPPQAHTPPAL